MLLNISSSFIATQQNITSRVAQDGQENIAQVIISQSVYPCCELEPSVTTTDTNGDIQKPYPPSGQKGMFLGKWAQRSVTDVMNVELKCHTSPIADQDSM